MLFLIEGKHGPMTAEEGVAIAKRLLPELRHLSDRGILRHAWARDGGGQVLVLEVEDRDMVDDLIATLPVHDSQEWLITVISDFIELLDIYAGSNASDPTPTEDG